MKQLYIRWLYIILFMLVTPAQAVAASNASTLFEAVKSGDLPKVEQILEEGVRANITDDKALTPLHYAANNGNISIAKLLLAKGAKLERPNFDGLTPLHAAAASGKWMMVEFLLSQGSDIEKSDREGWTSLHYAVKNNHDLTVELLLTHGANVRAATKVGTTPLMLAVYNNNETQTRSLLAKGANAAAVAKDGSAPLLFAAKNKSLGIAKMLLDHGAIPDKSGAFEGERHCERRVVYDGYAMRTIFICDLNPARFVDSGSPLYLAVNSDDMKLTQMLLEKGANPNDGYPIPPFASAIARGHAEMVRLLLEHGAKADMVFYDGLTPLHLAASHGHVDVMNLLLEHGAKLNAVRAKPSTKIAPIQTYTLGSVLVPEKVGLSSLQLAILNGQADAVAFLIKQGADLKIRTKNTSRYSVLELAMANDLLKYPASRGERQQGTAAYQPAPKISNASRYTMVDALLANGADINVKRFGDFTTLHMAAKTGDPLLVDKLISHGANASAKDTTGHTPAYYAEKEGFTNVATLLHQHE